MKFFIVLIAGFLSSFSFESSLYNIELIKQDGGKISMSSFRNKKIIITAFSTSNPDYGYLKYLGYLQSQYKNLVIIAIPAIDFGGDISDIKQKDIRDSLPQNIILTRTDKVNKKNGNGQQQLFKWLTNVGENSHFDVDVKRDDQLYIISESGVLYAVLYKPLGSEIMDRVLNEPDVKQ